MHEIKKQLAFNSFIEMSKLDKLKDYKIFIEIQAPQTQLIMGTRQLPCYQIKIDNRKKIIILSEDQYA